MVTQAGRATNIHQAEKLNWILILDVCEVRQIRVLRPRLDKTFIIGSPHDCKWSLCSRVAPLYECKHSSRLSAEWQFAVSPPRNCMSDAEAPCKHRPLAQLTLGKSSKQLIRLIAVNCSGAWTYAAEPVGVINIDRKSDPHLTAMTSADKHSLVLTSTWAMEFA